MWKRRHLFAVLTKRLNFGQVMPLALLACGGCTVIERVVVDPGSYLVHERGHVKTFKLMHIFHRTSLPLPAPSKATIALVPRAPGGGYPAARRIIEDTPRARHLAGNEADLSLAVDAISADVRNAAPWIVSNDPVVVAVGAERIGPKPPRGGDIVDGRIEPGFGVRLITANELDEKTSELRVLDQWPPAVQLWEVRLEPGPRTVRLSRPTTLREVLDQALWRMGTAKAPAGAAVRPATGDSG